MKKEQWIKTISENQVWCLLDKDFQWPATITVEELKETMTLGTKGKHKNNVSFDKYRISKNMSKLYNIT